MASVALPVRRPAAAVPGAGAIAGFALLTVLTLAFALRLPAATAVVTLAALGILHNVLELRYLGGRFAGVLNGVFLRLLAVLITGIVVCRALPIAPATRAAEIVITYAVIAVACGYALRRRPVALTVALLGTAAAGAVSLAFPDHHFVVLTHLHNVVPLVLLWEWSRQLPPPSRTALRAVQIGWVLAVPALLMAGVFDGLMAPATAWTGELAPAYTPPGWLQSGLELRFLTVFAFMATMHYLVWIWFMPRYAKAATEEFERRVPTVTGRRAWAIGLGGSAVIAVLFALDRADGAALYATVATYHAYLELPVLLVLLLGYAPRDGARS
jgi:hypothetical protein